MLTPYREVLLTNGTMLVLLGTLYSSGFLSRSFGLLLISLLVALLCALVELILCARALFTGRLHLAITYGILFLIIAKVDWWLVEQAE